jgi:hypothetical protein
MWAVHGGFSSVSVGGAAAVVSDVARAVGLPGCSSGGWDSSMGVVDELRGMETRRGGAVRCSGVVEVGRVVVVVVDGCDVAVDACDVGCDEGSFGGGNRGAWLGDVLE